MQFTDEKKGRDWFDKKYSNSNAPSSMSGMVGNAIKKASPGSLHGVKQEANGWTIGVLIYLKDKGCQALEWTINKEDLTEQDLAPIVKKLESFG